MADFIHDAAPVPSERYLFAVAHEEMNSRRRNTMEDCHRILPTLGEGLENYSYFGIYDGHGGRQIVDFLEDAFEQNIMTELKETDEACILEKLSRYAHSTHDCLHNHNLLHEYQLFLGPFSSQTCSQRSRTSPHLVLQLWQSCWSPIKPSLPKELSTWAMLATVEQCW